MRCGAHYIRADIFDDLFSFLKNPFVLDQKFRSKYRGLGLGLGLVGPGLGLGLGLVCPVLGLGLGLAGPGLGLGLGLVGPGLGLGLGLVGPGLVNITAVVAKKIEHP